MTCNCRSELESKLLERFKSEAPTGQNHTVALSGYGFCIIDNKVIMRPFLEVTQTADMPKKAGGFSVKRTKLNMYFSYCPFCGKPVMDQEGGAQ